MILLEKVDVQAGTFLFVFGDNTCHYCSIAAIVVPIVDPIEKVPADGSIFASTIWNQCRFVLWLPLKL